MNTQMWSTLSLLWTFVVLFGLIPAVLFLIAKVWYSGTRNQKRFTLYGAILFYVAWGVYLYSVHLLPSFTGIDW